MGYKRRSQIFGYNFAKQGFALPTILISSVVMLAVLLVSVSSTTAVRTAILEQYYTQLAQVAGDAGVAYAQACLNVNGNVPLWSDAKPLTPNTDCSGELLSSGTVKTLVVAGGGGGGAFGGGGGAGGFVYEDSYAINTGAHSVTVGLGGAGATYNTGIPGVNGGNSIFGTITAIGGGGGGTRNPDQTSGSGASGGSGGGSSMGNAGTIAPGGSGVLGQGQAGGLGRIGTSPHLHGGGGGAGAVGGNAVVPNAGAGGAGLANSISGSSVYYAGGGGGGTWTDGTYVVGPGGIGGGGAGSSVPSATGGAGTANTGGGGGGSGAPGTGGNGGSGIVIISYTTGTITATGGTITTSGGTTIHTFTSSGTFTVTDVAAYTCPDDARCSLMSEGNIRSSFRVGLPGLDADGKAKTIPNTGYVEIIRSSNNAVWRTYNQPSAQSAVVPDLCSGTATSALGWVNAAKFLSADSFPIASASTVGISTSNVNPGSMYFRKDFSVTEPGAYTLQAKADDASDIYIDGTYVTSTVSSSTTYSAAKSLSVGCHTVMAKVTNNGIAQNLAKLTLSLKRDSDSTPVVVTDSSWRVAAGTTRHFSEVGYYADPASWTVVRDRGAMTATDSTWAANTNDTGARFISTTHSYDGSGNYPTNQFTIFRDNRTIEISQPTTVRIIIGCDDYCYPYLNGNLLHLGGNGQFTFETSLTEGLHKFGLLLSNGTGPAGFAFTVIDTNSGSIITHSDLSWSAANFWSASNPTNSYSYDNSYKPNPDPLPEASVAVLAVGGGGGGGMDMGGGGGGGGVVYNPAYSVTGSVSVVIGSGGSGAPAGGTNGQPTAHQFTIPATNGGNTIFGTIYALGGGFGGSSAATYTPGITGGSGGSGGGSSGYNNPNAGSYSGGAGIIGQGNRGGNSGLAYYSGGGGGAGGAGASGPSQPNGGSGIQYPTMSPYYWGGGGGGASFSLATGGNGGIGGGGGGAVGVTTGGAGLNPGSAGGGGIPSAQTNMPGGNAGANTGGGGGGGSHYNVNNKGGNGGSGIVIVSYPTGSMTATGGTITTSGGNTIHTFTSNGTFTVTSIP